MGNDTKNLFELNFRYFEHLKSLSAVLESKIGVSTSCINCSVAIWAITTAVLFNPPNLSLVLVIIYIVFSVALISVAFCGWIKGFSATDIKKYNSFKLNPKDNEDFLKEGGQDKIYGDICEVLSKAFQDLYPGIENRRQSIKHTRRLSIAALAISIFLALFVIICKVNEIYDRDKSQVYVVENNNRHFNDIGITNGNVFNCVINPSLKENP
ncbi:MAG: hypothetical protein LBQ76_05045 [Candidatus Fibromonas sp.]|jgi:hypothetical protein|nr:hypothetical protein [Candidatus Fibromonas sp.]